jgi:hypothetical protein
MISALVKKQIAIIRKKNYQVKLKDNTPISDTAKETAKAKRKAIGESHTFKPNTETTYTENDLLAIKGYALIETMHSVITKGVTAIWNRYSGSGIDIGELEYWTYRNLAIYFANEECNSLNAITDETHMKNLAKRFAKQLASNPRFDKKSRQKHVAYDLVNVELDSLSDRYERQENVITGKTEKGIAIAVTPVIGEIDPTAKPVMRISNRVTPVLHTVIGIPELAFRYSITEYANSAKLPRHDLQLIEFAQSYVYAKSGHSLINWNVANSHKHEGYCNRANCINANRIPFSDNLPSEYAKANSDKLQYHLKRIIAKANGEHDKDMQYAYNYHGWNAVRHNVPTIEYVQLAIDTYNGKLLRKQFADIARAENANLPIGYVENAKGMFICPIHYSHEDGNRCSPNSDCPERQLHIANRIDRYNKYGITLT